MNEIRNLKYLSINDQNIKVSLIGPFKNTEKSSDFFQKSISGPEIILKLKLSVSMERRESEFVYFAVFYHP